MNLEKNLPKPWRRTRLFWIIIAVIAVVVIIAVVVPLAVILPRKNRHVTPAGNVIVPLYIYPSNDSSWAPLYDALNLRPDLNFTVIVNPNSGPGPNAMPDERYSDAVKKLNGFPNARTVGYVRTGYATRNISTVISEVNTYNNWFRNSSDMAMHGIFFDESPYEYTADAVTYMHTIDKAVKDSTGLQGNKTVIHNPGVVPDSRFSNPNLDITVVFEESYTVWQNRSVQVAALPQVRQAYSIMVNSVPSLTNSTMTDYVNTLSELAEFIYITSHTVNFYESFAPDWLQFVGQVPA